ncbi:MAG: H-X9-DG-CTERM domain-containing protein [Planctomycetota bacterium]|jgi:prepilin-type processing-associated H-X9-DG protein
MKHRIDFSKKDVMICFCCGLFLVANLGAVGSTGRRRAKEAVCVSNLKRWGTVFQKYAENHDGYFMRRTGAKDWIQTLYPYYSQRAKLLLCPEATTTYAEGGVNPHMAWPASLDVGQLKGSYGINLWISNQSATGRYWRTPYRANAAHGLVFVDAQYKDMQPYPQDIPPIYETDLWTPGPYNEMRRACVGRHNGAVNAVFLDGSVRKLGLKYLWRQQWYRGWDMDYPLPVWPEWMSNFKEP